MVQRSEYRRDVVCVEPHFGDRMQQIERVLAPQPRLERLALVASEQIA